MSDPVVHETTVSKLVSAQPTPRADAVVLTNENKAEYDDKILGTPPPGIERAEPAADSPEAKAKAEHAKIEKEKAERVAKDKAEAGEDIDHPDPSKKGKLNERFSELTKARKDAEAKAKAEAEARVVAEQKAMEKEREAAELRAKYEPAKTDELGAEPTPDQFADAVEYGKALKDYTAEKVRREDAAKARAEAQTRERESQAKAFSERQEAARKAIPDYDKKLADSPVRISDQLRDEIVASEVGPEILVHLADNPDVAADIAKMTVGQMLKAFGRLEAKIQRAAPKGDPEAKVVPIRREAEVSRAPEPINPISGGGDAVLRLSGNQEVPKNMTYEDWKKARQAGKIK